MTQTALKLEACKQHPDRYSTTTEPRTPTSPFTPNGHGGLVLNPTHLSAYDETPYDDVFYDEKLKQNNKEVPEFAPPPRTPGTAPAPETTWSQRKCRVRHCIVLTAVVVLVIVVAVGVGVAIVLTHNESSSSSSQTSSTPSSTSSSPVIKYSGNFQLQSPWEDSTDQLQENLSQDFQTIVSNSSLENYYLSTTLQHYRSQEQRVLFGVDFDPGVTSLTSQKFPDPVREFIQAELRRLIPQRKTKLDIIPGTFNLSEYIPETTSVSSSTSSTIPSTSSTPSETSTLTSTVLMTTSSTTASTTTSTTASTTTSTTASTVTPTTASKTTLTTVAMTTVESTTPELPDSCIPLDFDPCLGLNYTHYSLPNFLGGDTRELAVENFYFLGNDSLASGCTMDPSFFCAFAFPPCSAESIQTLPCLSTCQATVQRCLDYLPFPLDCEGYPEEPPCLASPYPQPPTTTPTPDLCSPQTFQRCLDLGFNVTSYPTWFAENEAGSIPEFQRWAMPAITSQCHPDVEFFMCSIFFPKCNQENGNVTFPCRHLCQDVEDHCYDKGDILNLDCRIFQPNQTNCLLPEVSSTTTTTREPTATMVISTAKPSTTAIIDSYECIPIAIDACRHFGHVNGSLPNTWGARDEATVVDQFYGYVQPVMSSGCSPAALFYSCEMLFPSCDDGIYLYPCRSVCREYNSLCSGLPGFFEQNCTFFQEKEDDPSCLLPPARKNCSEGEFSCEGAPLCVPNSSLCNQKNDCGDWSDERNCACNEEFEYRCTMGLCIRNYKRCNNQTDCPDGSDEDGCSNCKNGQFRCDDGTCIMVEWVCDGQYDCPVTGDEDVVEEDEHNCSACDVRTHFACIDGTCIPRSQRCDGTAQCPDQTDESSCMFLGPPAFINIGGEVLPICHQGFTQQLANLTCQRLGYTGAIIWRHFEYVYERFFQAAEDGTVHTIIGTGSIVTECNNEVLDIECAPAECGQRQNFWNQITDGMEAKPREIPWQASIQEFGKHFCGGSVIHPYFVLTAAHCVEKYTLNFEYMEVVLGAVDFTTTERGRRIFTIKRIIIHPDYLPFLGNDVALVELTRPVTFSNDIQPLCFREPGDVFTRASLCYTSGWGMMDPDSGKMATHLQIVKMTLWDTNKCNSSFAWDGQLQSTEICAGYYAGIKAACRGDSGGPLFCQDNNYRFKLVGVASYVHVGCNKPEKPVVYTDAVRYNNWISNSTVCQFKCSNGRCLFHSNMVCNKVDDCGDNSDEIDPCDISANCTFDDAYLCGYRSNWLWVNEALTANRYPLFDHSVGRYPGMYLLGAFRGKNLHTPRIDLTSPHCFRFWYHMRGDVRQGLAARVHELSQAGQWKTVWHKENYNGPDRWLVGQFDLEAGNYDIVFTAYDNGVATLDDTVLLPGVCQSHGCAAGEFACNTSGFWNCLPEAVRCNTVIDCDNAVDEKTCSSAIYMCDFENGLLCGLEQDSYDSINGEWRLVNASLAEMDDVTFGDAHTGHMLQIITKRLLNSEFVLMDHELYLGGQEHCLAFSYWSTSTVRMEIDFQRKNAQAVALWYIDNRQTSGWSRTHVSLPAQDQGYLQYRIIGRDLNRTVFNPMVALDNITITPGACPVFECPSGWSSCGTENYCLENSRFCDRVVDCRHAADEIVCECTAEEFKCPTGPCIRRERTCDTTPDCPDASDEGSICDSFRSISCDFENRFMCGYTHNGSYVDKTAYVWTRERNRGTVTGINIGTGPIYDHTYQNETGHWAFANGENGHPFDYVALQSPYFGSSGSDVLIFYYFAYSMFSHFWLTGTLGLLTRNHETGTANLSWFVTVDANDTWRSACVQLPRSMNLSIAFVSMRGKSQRADLAVDDVKLLQTTCDQFYTESRLRIGPSVGSSTPTEAPSTASCPAGQRACRSGFCIAKSSFCDGLQDCPDNSDEHYCDPGS